MTLRALVFDVDGTLAETEDVHRRAFNAAFAAAGLGWDWDRATYRRLLAVTGGKERIAAFAATLPPGARPGPEAIAALHRTKTRLYAETVAREGLALRPGVAALIEAARRAGLRLAVATTTSRANVEALARAVWGCAAGLVFDVIAAGDEVEAKKPAPDVYRLALDRLGLPAGDCLTFEDSRNGLLAALGAGIACVVGWTDWTEGEDFTGALWAGPSLDGFALPG